MINVLDEIDRLRLKRGWTEYELAKRSDLTQSTISSWYRKRQLPTIHSLNKICTGLGITLSEFFAGGEEPVALTPEERELLDHWTSLSPAQKQSIQDLLKHMGKE